MNLISQFVLPFRFYKFLIIQLMQREIKARYKQSFVGYAWVILNPLAQLAVYTFVFSMVFRFPTNDVPYVIFLYATLLPWTMLQASLSSATMSLVDNAALLRKVSFPREVIPYAAVLSKIVDFGFSAILFVVCCLLLGVSLAPTAFLIIPILLIQIILTLGLSLLLSCLNLLYRDIQYVTNLLLMVWMYSTPIVYPLSLVPDHLVFWYKLNPLVGIMEGYRSALFGYPFEWALLVRAAIASVIIFAIGFAVFKRAEKIFADIA